VITIAVWSLTKAEIQNNIETLVRRLSGQENLSYQERQSTSDAINAAMMDICLDYGISRWRFMQSDVTATTTASTSYVDLDENVFNVISGTVRIESEDRTLSAWDLEAIYQADPEGDETGVPQRYALDSSGTANTMRMQFWPIPNAAYTVSFVAETIMDEDSVSSFPSWLHAALKDRATQLALRDLGFFQQSMIYAASYQERLKMAKASQGSDAPMAIRRVGTIIKDNIQSRCP
jgi:hypothetical protein